jgi:2-(1,2-epoxy-1,2-dihydrophenyl)acetyl-CoA isomerase
VPEQLKESTRIEKSTVDGVRYEVANRVATLVFDRPDRSNAMDPPMQGRYGSLLRQAEADPEVRAIVVTGAGRTFCPGADLGRLSKVSTADPAAWQDKHLDVLAAALIRKPVVAAVNGGCAGLGFVIACAADVRFAAEGAKFTTAFARRGLVAEYGVAKLLPQLVGRGRAADLLLSGRTFTAGQAHEYGLVQELLPPGELLGAARTYATELATYSAPRSMATMKAQLLRDPELDLDTAAREAIDLMVGSFQWPELPEGLASWNERRPPDFAPYPTGS